MPYQYIDNFKAGMVRSRARHAGVPGSLWDAKNCVVNVAGEVVRRKPFREIHALPAGQTFGMFSFGGLFYVFGSAPGVVVPEGCVYFQLAHPQGVGIVEVMDVEPFFGKLYVVARYGDGSYHHFLDGLRVSDWDKLVTPYANFSDLATAFASKIDASALYSAAASGAYLDVTGHDAQSFSLTVTTRNGGTKDDQAAVVSQVTAAGSTTPGVSATGSIDVASGAAGSATSVLGSITVLTNSSTRFKVGSVKLNGIELLNSAIDVFEDFPLASPKAFLAQLIASEIQYRSGVTGVTGTFDGLDSVILSSANAAYDSYSPVITGTLNCTFSTGAMTLVSGGSNSLDSLTAGGTELLNAVVPYGASTGASAAAIANSINARTPTHGFSAVAAGDTITVTAPPGLGDSLNTLSLVPTVTGSFVFDTNVAFSGGVTGDASGNQVQRVQFVGTFEPQDEWTASIGGVPYKITGEGFQPGKTAFTWRSKVYSSAGSVLVFSAIRDGFSFINGIGAGSLNASSEKAGDITIKAMEEYAGNVAVFAGTLIYVFDLREDEDLNQLLYTIEGVGTVAAKSTQPFGSRDVFFLSWTGFRSLRSRNETDRAFVSDVGTAIDTFVQDWLAAALPSVVARTKSVIDPKTGSYIASVGTRAFVFSYYPNEKISAWTYWDFPTEPLDWTRDEKNFYVRLGDSILAYGGADGMTLPDADEVIATVELPFLDARTPAHEKVWSGVDVGGEGTWVVEVKPDINFPDETMPVTTVTQKTWSEPDNAFDVRSSHLAIVLTCASAGEAKLTDLALHHDGSVDQH